MKNASIAAAHAVASPAAATSRTWLAAGAAVPGVSHLRLGLPCQDAQAFTIEQDGTLLIAVSDGAGSAERSDQGAQAAVDSALRAMQSALEDGLPADGQEILLRDVFAAARASVLWLAEEDWDGDQALGPRAYACTLTCAIVAADWLAVGQVGDGAVVALDEGDTLFAVTRVQRGEYANETHFLVQEDALEQLTIGVVEQSVRGIAVMSDGLIRLALKMTTQEPHAPFFQPLFRFVESIHDPEQASMQLANFLSSERVNARTDDDKSLVLAVRANSRADGAAIARAKSAEVASGEGTSLEPEGE
jgi:hypothetical protein